MKKFILAAVAAAAVSLSAMATVENIMPRPQRVETGSGSLSLGSSAKVTDPTNTPALIRALEEAGVKSGASGFSVSVTTGSVAGAYDYELKDYEAEAYRLEVTPQGIAITAPTRTGVIRASQTLAQLAQDCNGSIPSVTITDWPAFKVRGFMQDVGRSWLPVEEIKREIDLLSRFKVNTFHWHLTDYTGWRLQINAYPQLTSDVAITRFPGKFYTQEQAREIQDYAWERGMTVIPEIDMPGHSHPFQNAMGHGMQTEEGIAELKVILQEVVKIFDKSPYIHIGGDEVSFPDSYIIDMIDYVHSLGKNVVIWNQYNRPSKKVDPSLIPCDMTTNWATAGRLSHGVPNIDMRYNYTNHFDVFADLAGIYRSSIFDVERGNPDVAGTISAAWNDTYTPTPDDIIRQNNQYANILASAERGWIGGGEYIERCGAYLPSSGPEFEEFADWERRFLHHKATTLKEVAYQIPYVRQTDVRWNFTEQIPNGGNASATLAPEQFIDADVMPSTFTEGGQSYGIWSATGAGHYLRHIWHGTVKGQMQNPQNGMTVYAWTYIYSEEEQDCGAFIEFYTYSRSGNEKAPDAGKWDRRGSRIWLNGSEIPAPQWKQPGKNIKQDMGNEGLTNENFTARPATKIHLRKGWNKVFAKLPHANNGGTGRDKWQFTFVAVDPDGLNALDNVIYSPNRTLDVESELLINTLNEMNAWRNSHIGSAMGLYPEEVAADYDAVVAEITATLDKDMTPTERQQQRARLSAAFTSMQKAAEATGANGPDLTKTYTFCTPLRGNRYATSQGPGQDIMGNTSLTDASKWIFERRSDGTFDIKNASDASYVSPASAYNTAIKTVAESPSAGWLLKDADTDGYYIVVSGSVQWNQTNAAQQFRVYNWGGGDNTSDTGCQYLIAETEPVGGQTPTTPIEPGKDTSNPDLLIVNPDLSAGPYRIDDSKAAPILAHEGDQTVAIDVTHQVGNGQMVPAVSASKDNGQGSHFTIFLASNGFGPVYTGLSNNTEGFYTRGTSTSGHHHVVMVMSGTDGYKYFLDEAQASKSPIGVSSLGQYGLSTFGRCPGAEAIYIGGAKSSYSKKTDFNGQIHSVRFYNRALTDAEVASLVWDNLTTGIEDVEADSSGAHKGIFDMTGRRLSPSEPLAPGIYVIDGRKTLVK
ncbi:MAG: family 20 glycosylhydrolase [Pseudoflavonifractor sp.]|nr:family 20 glycosylhydrolase [Alloprevotella sp.]MCM1116834.1 family 20 glycosylhydrolase [Pseudoflavonifractor sp.]